MVRLTVDYVKKNTLKPTSSPSKNDDSLKKITHLSLPEKSIDSIGDLSSIKNLNVLYLHRNNLQVIENLEKNDCLTHLYLQHNKITKMENLNNVKRLKKLYLGSNSISVVEGLETIASLEELHVECQQLQPGETIYFDPRTITNLANCVRVLDISGNNVASISDLKYLKAIEKLNASNNMLSDLPAVCCVICHWPRILRLDFRGNEIVRLPKYRDKIIASTDRLANLDDKDINDITRSFIHRFESVKEERRDKLVKVIQEQTPFSEDIASIAEHLPPGLRQSVSASVRKEAVPRAKSLTLSLMQVPVHSPGFLSDDSAVANSGLQPRPSRRVSNAESLARHRQKAERDSQASQPQLGRSVEVTGSNDEASLLGLYHIKNMIEPDRVLGLGDQQQLMDRQTAEQLWQLLKTAIQQIQSDRHEHLNFEELYRYGYYLVLHKYGGLLYSGLRDVISHHVTHKVRSKVLTNLNNNFLQVMTKSWARHQMSLFIIQDILMYLDRVYVKNNGVDDIYTLGLNLFKDHVVHYSAIQSFLQTKLLDLVMRERQGETMERHIFRHVTCMLMALGNDSPDVYQENFELPFLQQSAEFFGNESKKLLEEGNAPLYLRRAEQRIFEEVERAERCYDEVTIPKIVKVVEDELIHAHLKPIVEMSDSGVVHMMRNKLTGDLKIMYTLLSRVPDGLKTMFACISGFLQQQGRVMVSDDESNAISYIQNLLEIKESIDYYLTNSFCNDKLCKQMIATDFEHILNLNYKAPEYLSLFIDDRLKKTVHGMSPEDKSLLLVKTMVLFRFLQDKDMFEQNYKQHLAKRLLLSKTVNEENEMGIIAKLKAECGLHYTRKMEGMFRDVWTSSELSEEFRKHVSDTWDPLSGVELSVKVLTAVYWPTHNIPLPCVLPSRARITFETFKEFYLARHCGRQLTLLPQLGSAELEASFYDPSDGSLKSYTLPVSTYQMCVLMLFNSKPRWTLQELQDETNISLKDLQRSLQSLSSGKNCQKILIRQPDDQKNNLNDVFYVNVAFSSKTSRIKVPPIQIKFETGPDRQDTINKVNEDRKHEVEAAIIRVMKAHKSMKHDTLTNEVIKLLSSRFIPTKEMVKTRIEVLIEREYIARNSNDRRVYEYVA